MRTAEEMRKSLGPVADQYTDAQLVQLGLDIQVMAEIVVDAWFRHFDKLSAGSRIQANPPQ